MSKTTLNNLIDSTLDSGGSNTAAELRTLLKAIITEVQLEAEAFTNVTVENNVDVENDDLIYYDTSESGVRKTKLGNLLIPYEKQTDLGNESTTSTLTFTIVNEEALYELRTSRRNTSNGNLVVNNYTVHVSGSSTINVSSSYGSIVAGSFGTPATTRPTS
ncbi:MAG: hypothetical protein AAF391_07505, partial [Bacteroidota bacterium]